MATTGGPAKWDPDTKAVVLDGDPTVLSTPQDD